MRAQMSQVSYAAVQIHRGMYLLHPWRLQSPAGDTNLVMACSLDNGLTHDIKIKREKCCCPPHGIMPGVPR